LTGPAHHPEGTPGPTSPLVPGVRLRQVMLFTPDDPRRIISPPSSQSQGLAIRAGQGGHPTVLLLSVQSRACTLASVHGSRRRLFATPQSGCLTRKRAKRRSPLTPRAKATATDGRPGWIRYACDLGPCALAIIPLGHDRGGGRKGPLNAAINAPRASHTRAASIRTKHALACSVCPVVPSASHAMRISLINPRDVDKSCGCQAFVQFR